MRVVEIATESRRAPFEVAALLPARKLLEEVLDEVLLGELLDHLDLLDRDRELAGDGSAELHAGAPLGDEQPDELAVGHERDGET